MYREETLLNVIRSVTRNGRSIILTAVLALILVYMFSIIGYMFFKDDFLTKVDQVEDDDIRELTNLFFSGCTFKYCCIYKNLMNHHYFQATATENIMGSCQKDNESCDVSETISRLTKNGQEFFVLDFTLLLVFVKTFKNISFFRCYGSITIQGTFSQCWRRTQGKSM